MDKRFLMGWMSVLTFFAVGCGGNEGGEGESESEGESEGKTVEVGGVIVDPEMFLYARLGLMARATGSAKTGPCWDAPCTGLEALAYVLVPGSVVALEDENIHGTKTPDDGSFSLMAPAQEFFHFVTTPTGKAYVPTIDGLGTFCDPKGVEGVVIHACGNYGMMQLVADDVLNGGVVSVVVMDDQGIPEFMPIMEPDAISVEVTGGDVVYWVFNPTDPADADACGGADEDPCWGWQPLVSSPSDIPDGMIWIGMVSIVNPTSEIVHVEVTDNGAGDGRPYTYEPLDLPARDGHYTFAEAMPVTK